MPKKIYKNYVNYSCPNCAECFGNRKDYYERHLNKKNSCKKITPITPEFTPITPEFTPITPETKLSNQDKQKTIYNYCSYCNAKFSRKYNLDRHLDGRCKKMQKCDELNKQNELNVSCVPSVLSVSSVQSVSDILNINESECDNMKYIIEQLKQFKNELIKIKEENMRVKDENELLKEKIDKVEKKFFVSKTKNINTISNCNNITNNIINFSNMDYSKIDTDYFVGPMLDNKLFGRGIVLKVIENVHANDKLPEYKNYVITDKNRGYAKMYDNGMWKSTDINGIEIILCGVIEQMRTLIEEIEDGNLESVKKALRKEIQDIKIDFVNRRIEINKKYLDKSDLDKIEELKEDDENKEKIKAYIEYRDILIMDIKNMFHDNKDKIKLK